MRWSCSIALGATAAVAAFLVGGCATSTLVQLNDPARSSPARDVANLLPPRDIPYETSEKRGIAVSYNLFFSKSSNLSGYRLTLIIRNNTSVTQLLRPVVLLQESNGLLISPYAYDAFVAEAASLAGTVVPSIPYQHQPMNYYRSGTISNTTAGTSYAYSSTTTYVPASDFANSFARGMAQGAAIRATNAKEEGRLTLRWANSFWLRSSYELPPGAAASGALFFPAASLGQTPLRLSITLGDETYTFVGLAQ